VDGTESNPCLHKILHKYFAITRLMQPVLLGDNAIQIGMVPFEAALVPEEEGGLGGEGGPAVRVLCVQEVGCFGFRRCVQVSLI